MKYLGHLTILSLFCLPAFASYPDEINYPHYQNIFERNTEELNRVINRFEILDRSASAQYARILELHNTFNTYSNERVGINNRIQSLSNESRNLISQRDRLVREERDIGFQLNRARSDYERMRREVDSENRRLDPLRSQLNRLQNEINSARSNYNAQNNRVNSVRGQLTNAQNSLTRVRADISRTEAIPNRTPNQQAHLDNLYRNRSQLEGEISRTSMQLSQEQNRANQLAQDLSRKENELRNSQGQYDRESRRLAQLQSNLNNQQRIYNDLERRFSTTRSNITNTERRLSSISSEVMNLENRKRDIERAQASIRMDIDSSQNHYNQQLRDLEVLRQDIQRQRVVVASSEEEYLKREHLYGRYFEEAQSLGSSQVINARSRGWAQGLIDAEVKGSQLGNSLGDIQGLANANFWGAVRAEVIGYKDGYAIGYSLPRTEAQSAADRDAQKAARSFVETVLRPGYFEEVVQQEIKKPFVLTKKLEVSNFIARFNNEVEGRRLEVSENELAASDALETPYDEIIKRFEKEKKSAEKKYNETQNAINSYAHQEKYPFDKLNCSSVYKGVADFKAACEESFTSHYVATYENAAYNSYLENFSKYFSSKFESSYEQVLSKQYEVAYKKAYDASKVFGTSEGKRVMYEEAYALQYEISYEKHLALEKTRVRHEVAGELEAFLDNRALLTMVGLETNEEVIAGDTLTISSILRNLGRSKGAIAHLNITKVSGAQIVSKMVSTSEVSPRSQVKLSGPKVRVLPELITGNTFSVEVEATLPGDNYQSARVEKLVLNKKVSVNPAQELLLNVDYSPSIRSVLRRFLIHTLSVDSSAKFEDLKTDLDVRLVALSGAEHVEIKVSEQKVLKMKKGEKRNLKFSYVFKDSANGQSIKLALQFLYKGRVVQTQEVVLKPH